MTRWFQQMATVIVAMLVLTTSLPGQASAHPLHPGPDPRIDPAACTLLGRIYVQRAGCARDACVAGAVAFDRDIGAEVCAPRTYPHAPFATAVDFRRCRALHRRWIPQVNWCASNPDRGRAVIAHADQCLGAASTYVTLTDVEPFYDECLTPGRVGRLVALALREHRGLRAEARTRSRVLCSYRPEYTFRQHRCSDTPTKPKAAAGTLLIGDSIAWRGTDELAALRPTWAIDGLPGRRFDDLAARLAWYEQGHQPPDVLILELGSNAAHHVDRARLLHELNGLPPTTHIVVITPYRSHTGAGTASWTVRYTRWLGELASSRPDTCLADWRDYVRRHSRLLVDGVHPTSRGEGTWARWVIGSVANCA